MSTEIKNVAIRRLKKKDRTMLTTLITKLVEKTGSDELINMIPKADSEDSEGDESSQLNQSVEIITLAFNLLEGMVKYIEEDITPWFIDLIGCTREEYEDMDFDIELQVISSILESGDFANFFSKGSQVRNGIMTFVSRLRGSRGQ